MSNSDVKLTRSIGLFSLVMINIIAINSIRTVPFASHFGQELIGYFILATVLFFLPLDYSVPTLPRAFLTEVGYISGCAKAWAINGAF